MCPVYVFEHKTLDTITEIECKMSELDKLVEEMGPDWRRVYEVPQIRTEKLSVSFVDGVIPNSKKKDYDAIKRAAKLEVEAYNMKPSERGKINKEIRKEKEIR